MPRVDENKQLDEDNGYDVDLEQMKLPGGFGSGPVDEHEVEWHGCGGNNPVEQSDEYWNKQGWYLVDDEWRYFEPGDEGGEEGDADGEVDVEEVVMEQLAAQAALQQQERKEDDKRLNAEVSTQAEQWTVLPIYSYS